ncbi:MAG: DUF882 domain-containing protein [Deltaproteobacteria bacterium]|nr:DUF882 domain-containing protein [Deltaproteobacteria bacterium]
MRVTAFLAMGVVLVANAALASALPAPRNGADPRAKAAKSLVAEKLPLTTTSANGIDAVEPWAAKLGPIEVLNRNTNAQGKIRLYDDHGVVDRGAARDFMRIAGRQHDAPSDASDDDERLDLRLVQLVVRASYHFGGAPVKIISGTRPGGNGKHGTGEALDFSLEGVKAPLLAAYLRGTPRAGVGIYTHPKTQYVHLDVRDRSFHWIDGSPPGVTWREQLISDPKQGARDASYAPTLDLPEH